MSTLKITNANLFDAKTKTFVKGALIAQDGIITEITSELTDADAIDLGGKYVLPGMVDIHTHGRAGYDFDSATVEQFHEMQRAYAKAGTTTVMATIASAPMAQIEQYVANCKETNAQPLAECAASIAGIHFEGRYLNPSKRGAHNAELLAALDEKELEGLLNQMKPLPVHLTAAVEMENGEAFTKKAVSMGATVSLGHTEATMQQAAEALTWGVTGFTHTFNAMSPVHHRNPGTMLASLLLDDAWSEVICDGFHVCPEMVLLLHREKPEGKLVLISDSMAATGCPDGDDYSIAGMPVSVKDGKAYTSDGAIAGSTLNLFDGMKNYARFAGISIEEAILHGSLYPAQMVGIDGQCGSIEVGKRADLLVVDNLNPEDMPLVDVFANGYQLNK
ncbi:MAG: N-acetylglucosamine-6-phosphate deacetylase [Clostridiales bacterium]|nr:N-acetylglucosamine-6-phosphate deacetylase [Clostridiales bacterium]